MKLLRIFSAACKDAQRENPKLGLREVSCDADCVRSSKASLLYGAPLAFIREKPRNPRAYASSRLLHSSAVRDLMKIAVNPFTELKRFDLIGPALIFLLGPKSLPCNKGSQCTIIAPQKGASRIE